MRRFAGLVLVVLVIGASASASRAATRPLYEARTIASVPPGDDGYIEGIAYDGTYVYSGTAYGARGTLVPMINLNHPSRIFVWHRKTGKLAATILVKGEDTTNEHGITGLKADGGGRVYALSDQLGLLLFTRGKTGTWSQQTIVALPDLPPCGTTKPPCSPTKNDRRPLGNDMTWGRDGALYISDSFQATIWKVTFGQPVTIKPWFQSEVIDRVFGANGLRLSPDGKSMMIAVTGPDSFRVEPIIARPPGVIAVPFPDPAAGKIRQVLVLPNGDVPDGIAYGEHGDLFVLANSAEKIYIVRTDRSVKVIANADLSGDGRMDFPASLVFDGAGALLITNYSWVMGATPSGSRTVIDVWVDDVGIPEPARSRP